MGAGLHVQYSCMYNTLLTNNHQNLYTRYILENLLNS